MILEDLLHRDCEIAFPEFIEVFLHVPHRRSQQEHVAIAEIEFVIEAEVFGGHVASAGEAGDTVKDGCLVVHALADVPELRDRVLQLVPGTHADYELGL